MFRLEGYETHGHAEITAQTAYLVFLFLKDPTLLRQLEHDFHQVDLKRWSRQGFLGMRRNGDQIRSRSYR
jgi:hypothetical protein